MYDLSRTAVLVDRQPLWLDALEAVLERLQFHVIARASCWNDAERLVREHDPDILVGDAGAAASDGCLPWSALARVKERKPRLKCVVLAEADDRGERERAFAAGADVYCVKASDPADVAVAIRQAFKHSIFFAAAGVTREPTRPTSDQAAEAIGLTKREREILRLLAEGHANAQLGRILWVTEQTVKFHLSNIYRKLDVSNRTEASRWAQLHGLLEAREQELAVA